MSMAEQMRRMKALYPGFEVTFNGGWRVVWEGNVRPLSKTYRLRVSLIQKEQLGEISIGPWCPQVWLVNPNLQLSTDRAPGVQVLHIYINAFDPMWSGLCLFDPATGEWTQDMAVAETTIPWAIDWLTAYEGWLATGQWTGGGRDHGVALK